MANDEDLARLRQGVAVWNDWRKQNRDSRVDLGGANLRKTNLREANLYNANLSGADLHETNLRKAYFYDANLSGADLHGADLRFADLSRADLHEADLRGMDLHEADLSAANLHGMDLSGADLRDADLRQATLIDSRLASSNLTGTKLWETQRDGWSIKGVICQRAFWDRDGKEPTEYGVGDFERVFAEKPRIVLRYPRGMLPVDLIMLPVIIEHLQADHPNCALHIRSVQDDGSGATVIITVDDLANRSAEVFGGEIAALRSEVATLQHRLWDEEKLKLAFEAKYQALTEFFRPMLGTAIRRQAVHIHRPVGPTLIGGGDIDMSGDNYDTTAGIAVVGREAHVHDNTFQQIWNQADIDLPKLTEELSQLRSSMRREAAEGTGAPEQDEATGAVAAAEKAAARGDGPTVLRHLKIAGKWTLGIAEKIGVAVAAEAIKRAMVGPA